MLAATASRHTALRSKQLPPKDLSEIKQRIVSGEVFFSERSERVLRIVIEDPGLAAFGTISSVARACSVSPATVTRAARALGFKHFRDLRAVFREYVRQSRQ
jgi:DNA-binding MurR/RpiR family transcriptional regulator